MRTTEQRALRVGGTATYTDAKLTTAAPFLAAAAGTRIPFSPKLAFALNGSYSFPISDGYSGVLTVTDRFSGERNAGFGTAKSVGYRLPSYNTVNVDLALSTPHNVEFDLYAHNLTNSYGRISAYTAPLLTNPASPVEVLIAQPRTIGVVAKFEF